MHLVVANSAQDLRQQRFFNLRHDQLMHVLGIVGTDLVQKTGDFQLDNVLNGVFVKTGN